MSSIDVAVPDIGDFHDIPVIDILVKPGDTVKKEDALVTLESEKATMDVPSPAEGIVETVRVKLGDKVSEGSVIVTVATAGAVAAAPPDPAPPAPAAAGTRVIEVRVPDIGDFHDVPVIDVLVKAGDTVKKEDSLVTLESEKATMDVPSPGDGVVQSIGLKIGDRVSQGTFVLTLTSQAAGVPEKAAPLQAPAPPPPTNGKSHHPSSDAMPESIHASPSIRRFARELGVPLASVSGSGPNGRITRDDVQNFVKRALKSAPGAAPIGGGLAVAQAPKIDFAAYGPIERQALTRIQRLSGPALHRNWVTIPHVTNNDDADITELEAFRRELNAEKKETKVTMLAFLIKACVAALKEFPRFNSSLDGDGIVLKHYYNIGFAADTPEGLLVPVIKHADQKGIFEIASETAELAAKARAGKLPLADMQGGTFSISSLGGIGGTYFTPIINAPEVAILGVCRAAMRPIWNAEINAFEPKLMLPLSLSWDHRVIDGAAAARFNTHLIGLLGDMRRTLL
jgi:pyruvate dehydrogenase E2 component (dihydrolipoamide acetyltransferase)